MDVEKLKQQLREEGFPHVFEWADAPNTKYEAHPHQGKVSFYLTRGEVEFFGGIRKVVKAGERFDVPPHVNHSAVVGPEGADWVVGEEVEGDT